MHSDLWPLIHVFLDWDGTITKKDTLEVVAKIGYDKNPTSRPWNDIVKAYLDDYRAHQYAYTPSKDQRTTIKEESAWLESLSEIESRSINRVREAGVFKGVHENNVLDSAIRAIESRSVQLRHGWTDLFFSDPSQPGDPRPIMDPEGFCFHILSVNWSATFIKGCILHAAILEQPKVASKALMSMTHLANEIAIDARSTCSVDKEKITIQTSADKLRILKKSVHGSVGSPQRNSKKTVTVYVGDSATDFDALLHVDVGICVRDEPLGSGQIELAETLGRVGVLVKPLAELELSLLGQETISKILWWTNDLKEVSSALEKILATVKDCDQRV